MCVCVCQRVCTMHAHASYLNQRLADREGAAEQNEQMYKHCGGEVNVVVNCRTRRKWIKAEVSVQNEDTIYILLFCCCCCFVLGGCSLNTMAALVTSGTFVKHFGFLVCLKSGV